MATTTTRPPEPTAVDYAIDPLSGTETAPSDTTLKAETELEQAVGVRGPTGWWRMGLVALAALVLVLLVLRVAGGNTGTAVIPGTPVAAPQTQAVQ